VPAAAAAAAAVVVVAGGDGNPLLENADGPDWAAWGALEIDANEIRCVKILSTPLLSAL
jgi:hypothetical protein